MILNVTGWTIPHSPARSPLLCLGQDHRHGYGAITGEISWSDRPRVLSPAVAVGIVVWSASSASYLLRIFRRELLGMSARHCYRMGSIRVSTERTELFQGGLGLVGRLKAEQDENELSGSFENQKIT